MGMLRNDRPEWCEIPKQVEKALPPFAFQEHIAAGLATVHDMVERPGVFDS